MTNAVTMRLKSLGFSPESVEKVESLLFEEAAKEKQECRPRPEPRTQEQKQATQQAQQSAQQQNQTFDTMPQAQQQEIAKQGGQAEREKKPPLCPK
jgi:hypothetical protein